MELQMCILIFSEMFFWKIFHFEKNSMRYHKCTYVIISSTRYYLSGCN
jgi:hypothetical protein